MANSYRDDTEWQDNKTTGEILCYCMWNDTNRKKKKKTNKLTKPHNQTATILITHSR